MIPEDAFTAATEAITKLGWSGFPSAELARKAVEAAAPLIAAQALEDAADAFDDLRVERGVEIKPGTWDYFELFPLQHIRDRADAIRKEAGL